MDNNFGNSFEDNFSIDDENINIFDVDPRRVDMAGADEKGSTAENPIEIDETPEEKRKRKQKQREDIATKLMKEGLEFVEEDLKKFLYHEEIGNNKNLLDLLKKYMEIWEDPEEFSGGKLHKGINLVCN
jgi:hypothetical protein